MEQLLEALLEAFAIPFFWSSGKPDREIKGPQNTGVIRWLSNRLRRSQS